MKVVTLMLGVSRAIYKQFLTDMHMSLLGVPVRDAALTPLARRCNMD